MTATQNTETDPRLRPVLEEFERMLDAEPGLSAQLAIRVRDRVALDVTGGPGLAPDSLTGVYSVSKAVGALVVGLLLDRGTLDLDAPVARYWPEFAAAGKGAVTVRQLLSHQAGLVAVEGGITVEEVTESRLGAAKLAAQLPAWVPGTAIGYHALTLGILMEELVRRADGRRLQEIYDSEIRALRGIEFHLGLPAELDGRYVPIRRVVLTSEQAAAIAAAPPRDDLSLAATPPLDLEPDDLVDGASTNDSRIRRAGPTALGGVGSARGLAQLFSAAIGEGTAPILSASTRDAMSQQQSWGHDRVLNVANAFGVVFLKPQPRMPYAGHHAIGHDGAGGALAFGDPANGLAFGYIPSPMQYPGGADPRSIRLARLAAQCLE